MCGSTVQLITLLLLLLLLLLRLCAGLGLQLLFFPDSLPDEDELLAARTPKGPQLPKVTVTSSTDEIRRAFESVSKTAAESNGSSSRTASSSGSATPVGAASAGGDSTAASTSTDSS
jgi:hypothetical protein